MVAPGPLRSSARQQQGFATLRHPGPPESGSTNIRRPPKRLPTAPRSATIRWVATFFAKRQRNAPPTTEQPGRTAYLATAPTEHATTTAAGCYPYAAEIQPNCKVLYNHGTLEFASSMSGHLSNAPDSPATRSFVTTLVALVLGSFALCFRLHSALPPTHALVFVVGASFGSTWHCTPPHCNRRPYL